MDALSLALPLLSVLLGAGITYAVNVRTRRASKAEDAYHDAIAAVAEAIASRDYATGEGKWFGQTEDEAKEFQRDIGKEATRNYVHCVAAARSAVARASAYDRDLQQFLVIPAGRFVLRADEVIERLRGDLRV